MVPGAGGQADEGDGQYVLVHEQPHVSLADFVVVAVTPLTLAQLTTATLTAKGAGYFINKETAEGVGCFFYIRRQPKECFFVVFVFVFLIRRQSKQWGVIVF